MPNTILDTGDTTMKETHTHTKKHFPFMEFRGREETKQKNKIHSA